MDPVAHTLFGATLAEAGLKEKTALAAGTLIIGANLPDIDVIAVFRSSDYALFVRRGWTHGILALILWPFILTGLMLLYDRYWRQHTIRRKGRWRRSGILMQQDEEFNDRQSGSRTVKQKKNPGSRPVRPGYLLGIAFLAVWSHPFLDWLNTYGIRLLMPFDDTWFYGDTLFIIDPWVWLMTGAAVVLARSESGPGIAGWIVLGVAATALITGTAVVPLLVKVLWFLGVAVIILFRWMNWFYDKTRRVAGICLLALALYVGLMYFVSRATVREANEQLSSQGIDVRRTMAEPLPSRLLVREGVAASSHNYYRFRFNWLTSSFELLGDPVPVEEPDEIVQKALQSPEVQGLRTWMRFPYYEVQPTEDGWRVFIRDLRFAGPDQTNDSGVGMAVVDVSGEDVQDEELDSDTK